MAGARFHRETKSDGAVVWDEVTKVRHDWLELSAAEDGLKLRASG